MMTISSDSPHRYVTCDDCGEMTNEWFTETDHDGREYETAICHHCQRSREDWSEEQTDNEFDQVSI